VVTPPRPKFVIPLLYVVLDVLGLMLLGLGSATVLGKDVLPAAFLSFDFIGWLLIVAGLFCMSPIIIFIFKAVRTVKNKMRCGITIFLQKLEPS
jgi:tellurite resistance protein TehA-like permease